MQSGLHIRIGVWRTFVVCAHGCVAGLCYTNQGKRKCKIFAEDNS